MKKVSITTEKFNRERSEAWVDQLTKQDARIFLICALTPDNGFNFMTDDAIANKDVLADRLEHMAKCLRGTATPAGTGTATYTYTIPLGT